MTHTSHSEPEQEAAYREYERLKRLHDDNPSLKAGVLAGKAWARFVYLFSRHTERPSAKIIPLPIRHDLGGAA